MKQNRLKSHGQQIVCFFLVFSILSLLGCVEGGNSSEPKLESEYDPVTVTGRVLDSTTGDPIQNASIWTDPATSTTTTSASGIFSIQNGVDRNVNQYRVYASASGYADNSSVVLADSGGYSTADIQLHRQATGLATNPSALRFSKNEISKTFYLTSTINNSNFTIESTETWLRVTPISGTIVNASGDRKIITVSVDRNGLATGNHSAELSINSTNVSGTTLSVIVAVNSSPPPSSPLGPISLQDDAATVEAGSTVTINPLTNDSGSSLQITGTTPPTKGTITRSGSTIEYTANTDASGTDSFTYTVGDSSGESATATIVISITSSSNTVPFGKPITTRGYTFTPGECELIGTSMTCHFKVVANISNNQLRFRSAGFGDQTRAIVGGVTYDTSYVALGSDVNVGQYFGAEATLIKGVAINGSTKIEGIPNDTQSLDLLNLTFKSNKERFDLQFFDAKVTVK